MSKLGYSGHFSESLDNKLNSLNLSITNEEGVMSKFKEVEFEFQGSVEKENLELIVNVETTSGKKGVETFSSHVDEGSFSYSESVIMAYYGEHRYREFLDEVKSLDNVDTDYIKENEPEFFEQLCQEYLLFLSPDVEGGSEFTSEDQKFFDELYERLENPNKVYDEKIELNEYIEKFSEIQPLLDQHVDNINIKTILLKNDGCKEKLVKKIIKYLENHSINVIIE